MTAHTPVTAAELRRAPDLTAAFALVCRRFPDRVAIRDDGTAITYRALADRVHVLARALTPARAPRPGGPPRLIATVLPNGIDLVCVMLAALEAGAAHLTLDPAAPDSYLRDVIARSGASVVVTDADRLRAGEHRTRVATTTLAQLRASTHPRNTTSPTGDSAHPAYVVHTSGSTGEPKGVVVPHRALLASTAARIDAYGTPEAIPLLHSPAFDVHTGTVYWALLTGATLVTAPAGLVDVPATLDLLHDHAITHLLYPASLYPVLLDHAARRPPAALRVVAIGSEAWSEEVAARHARVLPHAGLHNEYGPSETCVWTSQARVYDPHTRVLAPMSIGRPAPGTAYHRLDRHLDPIEDPSVPAELYISGANLALGYLNRPDLTARCFVTLPDGRRAYRTGDLIRVDEHGDHVFVGRADRQVQINGHRIEPAHVENVLMSRPDIAQARVIARTDGADTTLLAYLVPAGVDPEVPFDTTGLRADVARCLPTHLRPHHYLVLADLPRTPTGKIDTRRLPTVEPDPAPQEQDTEPAGRTHEAIVALVADLMGRRIAPDASLIEAGASSLTLLRLSARIAATIGVDVPASALFAHPTIRAIADLAAAAPAATRPPPAAYPDDDKPIPLTAQQAQIHYLGHLAPDALAYTTQCALDLTGPLDPAVLAETLTRIVARQEILRTTVHDTADGPVQVVHPPWTVPLDVVDLSAETPVRGRHRMLVSQRALTRTPFDPAALPLVRWRLFRLGPDRWRLFQSEHHHVHDGWSATVLMREIRDVYAALTAGREPELAPLPVRYRDYARWQHAWTGTDDHHAQATYWHTTLAGAPPHGPTFPPDRPRGDRQAFTGGCVRVDVPATTVTALDTACARHHTTRFAVFLTAFALLLHRHTAEDDLTIGSAFANRRHPQTADLLGMFVNALPLRLPVRDNDSIGDTIREITRRLWQAQDHQEYPLIDLIRRLDLPRDNARNALFSLMFAFHDTPRPPFDIGDLHGELWIEHNGSAKNDMNIVCVPNPAPPGTDTRHDGVNVLWEYDRALYDETTVQCLAAEFLHLLEELPTRWDTRVDAVPHLGPDRATEAITAGRGPCSPLAHPDVPTGVDAARARTPHAPAVVCGDRVWTHNDLEDAVRTTERHLTAHHITPGDVVALALGNTPEHVAATLAVQRRGAVFVALDTTAPAARLHQLLRDADPALLLHTDGTREHVEAMRVTRVNLDDHSSPDATAIPARPTVDPQEIAYLVYTSGSTGEPKAVATTRRNAAGAVHARLERCDQEPPTTLITLPTVFDVAPSATWWTLWLGGTVVLPGPGDDVRDPDTVLDLVRAHHVTHLNLVASFHRHLLEALSDDARTSLRVVAVGGEPCDPDTVRAHARLLPDVELHNEYGPTETTVWCTAATLHTPGRTPPPRTAPVSIGTPITNHSAYVVDERLRPVPDGERGELCVAGVGVAAGYHRRPDLTARQFVVPDAGPLRGLRLYRTGDRAHRNPDGTLELHGRLDDQVQIRGHRVEPGEIRAHLLTHPGVRDAHVGLDDHGTTPRLTAWIAPESGSVLAEPGLCALAAAALPPPMRPAAYVLVPELPRTATGKIDRTRLPRPDHHPRAATDGTATTATERALLDTWRTVMERRSLGIDDDFFDAGGDSLIAIRACTHARTRGLNLSVAQLLRARTVRALAADLDREPTRAPAPSSRRPAGTRIALTAIQEWFFAQDFADPDHFNQARVFDVADHVDTATLLAAVTHVTASHDAFRTHFVRHQGIWTAVLDDQVAPDAVVERDLRLDTELTAALEQMHAGLDLRRGPLWRLACFRDPTTGRRVLCVVAHHLVVDTVSWDIWRHHVDIAHSRLADPAGRLLDPPAPGPPTHTPPPPDPEDAARWTRLAAAPKPPPPDGDPVPYGQLLHTAAELSPHATRHLTRPGNGITTLGLLLAALHRALTPQPDGTPLYLHLEGHGRGDLDHADAIIGWFTALYPMLLDDEGHHQLTGTAAAFTRRLDAVPHGGTGYGRALHHPEPTALCEQLRALPPPTLTFNHHGHTTTGGDPTAALTPSTRPTGTAIGSRNVLPTAVHVSTAIHHDRLRLHITHDPTVLNRVAAEALQARFTAALEHAARVVTLTRATTATTATRDRFLVHPIGGAVDAYLPLARALGPRHPCHGLPHDGATDDPGIPGLAAAYVRRVRHAQPHGPYTLTGWSFGAAVAYEMTRLLETAGETVDLTLLDPPQPVGPHDPLPLAGHITRVLPGAGSDEVRSIIEEAFTRPDPHIVLLRLLLRHVPAGDDTCAHERLSILVRNHQALDHWRSEGTVARLRIVRPRHGTATEADDATWQARSRAAAEFHTVPGDHNSMLRPPHVAHLATLLRNASPR